jgi:hypothetical protein
MRILASSHNVLITLLIAWQVREGDPHLVETQQHRPPRAPARLRVRLHVCRFSFGFCYDVR